MITRGARLLKRFLKDSLFSAAPASGGQQVWSIGLYGGTSPFGLTPANGVRNPVLSRVHVSDVPAAFVADPFLLRTAGAWHMFFEVMNRRTSKGEIGLATSANGRDWSYREIVLTEPFHVSYPYVFEVENEYYMVPESCQANSVRLYRAVRFPTQWSVIGTLLDGRDYVDPSIFRIDERWWLFAGHGTPPLRADVLRLFHAERLEGPWREHRASPLAERNIRATRPAGRVLVLGNRVVRYAQDCFPFYGTRVRAFEIVELTTETYREREIRESPVLQGTGRGWNAGGMHHIDLQPLGNERWIASVDGWVRQGE
jgi:hypothetical protein